MAPKSIHSLSLEHESLYAEAVVTARTDMDSLMESLSGEKDLGPEWIVSSVFTRNPHQGRFYLECERLRFIDLLIENEKIPQDGLLVEDEKFASVLRNSIKKRGLAIEVTAESFSAVRYFRAWRPLFRFFKTSLRMMRHWLICVFGVSPRVPEGPAILLDGFLLNTDFSESGYHNRFFPELDNFLSPGEMDRLAVLSEAMETPKLASTLRAAHASSQRFLLKGNYLTLGDYASALAVPFRLFKTVFGPARYRDYDVAVLVQRELHETAWNLQSTLGYLNFRFARRLARKGPKIALLVEWFENQATDAGMCLGFRTWLPDVPIVGYCGYAISPRQIAHMAPSLMEKESGCLPDRLAVIGPAHVGLMKTYFPACDIFVGPALRFAHVWDSRKPEPPTRQLRILVGLPQNGPKRDFLMENLLRLAEGHFKEALFRIKPHPTLTPEALRDACGGSWPANFEIVGGSFADRIRETDLLIGSFTSSLLESLAMGVPSIVFGETVGAIEHPIPAGLATSAWRTASSDLELIEAVSSLNPLDPQRRAQNQRLAEEVRTQCFTETTRDSVVKLLMLEFAGSESESGPPSEGL